ncbi:MAG: alpha-ketoacid dehydrogenase subunit beta [Actinomycetota bacterium]
MRQITYRDAIREAIEFEMRRDPRMFLAGEDAGRMGGANFVTKPSFAEFGTDRIKDTPISETAIIGLGVGAAVTGLRPVVEITFMDFMGVCMDEVANQAAKMRYMFGGKAKIPLVIRTVNGAGNRTAAQHSQSLEAWLTHIPGLKVVMPSTPANAKGLFLSSVRDDNPIIFVENRMLYSKKGDCPEGEYLVPLGKANIMKEGSDATIISWSRMVHTSLAAANLLAKEGINCEVIDLQTLVPLDKETILASIKKTGKAVIVHEAVKTSGFGAEVAAIIADEAFSFLKSPIKRVTAPDTPIPYASKLEDEFIPNEAKIISAVKSIM